VKQPIAAKLRPRPAEQLLNLMVGCEDDAPDLPGPLGNGVLQAIEAAMLPALQRAPCAVSFSGGRDSSAVLAIAADVARRYGLALPVPVIMRFPGAVETDETAYQELVLQHLGLEANAIVIDARADHDALGDVGTSVLINHGLMWPANAYMHLPIMRQIPAGSLLTGVGGDELFDGAAARGSWRQRAIDVLPARLQEPLWLHLRSPTGWEWLTPAGRDVAMRALARDEARWPRAWGPSIAHWAKSRSYAALSGTLQVIGQPLDVTVIHPLIAPPVLSEHVRDGGFASRTAAMVQLCGTLLPDRVVTRTSKAHFTGSLWGPATRAFISSWNGEGVDGRLIDVGRLRAELMSPMPDFRTILPLQSAWLSSQS
jgi:hypothetical protein